MTRRLGWLGVAPAFLMVVGLGAGTAVAADKTKVDEATKQVQQLFKGIGNTIVEGAKFSGNTIAEAFKK